MTPRRHLIKRFIAAAMPPEGRGTQDGNIQFRGCPDRFSTQPLLGDLLLHFCTRCDYPDTSVLLSPALFRCTVAYAFTTRNETSVLHVCPSVSGQDSVMLECYEISGLSILTSFLRSRDQLCNGTYIGVLKKLLAKTPFTQICKRQRTECTEGRSTSESIHPKQQRQGTRCLRRRATQLKYVLRSSQQGKF